MKKRLLSLLFVTVVLATFLFSVISGSAAVEWRRVTYISAGETYLFAAPNINDTVSSFSSCVLKNVQSADVHGLAYCQRPSSGTYPDDCLWTVESASGGYYLKSVSTGKYLNMKPATASDGTGKGYATMATTPQVLNLTVISGKVKISASLGGVTYYIRFTNTYRSAASGVSCWEAATADGSNQLEIYCRADTEKEYNNTTKPLFTVACFSDPHVDYGIQSWSTPIRQSTITSAKYVRDTIGAADVVLVGGDMTSNNGGNLWTMSLFQKVQKTMYETLALASKDGKVLFVSGNHENEAGINSGNSMYTGNYDSYMTGNVGPFDAALYFNEMGKGTSKFNELLCYRYTIGKMEFIGINTPYRTTRSNGYIYLAQIEWVEQQLKAIGKEKTVIVTCHYPIDNIDTAPGDTSGAAKAKLKSVLEAFPNVIYTYGHVHGDDYKYAWYSTSELVVPQGETTKLSDNSFKTDSYIVAHMGSMGYYYNQFNNYNYLSATEPGINQLLMIEFYIDHITFRYYNTGEKVAVDGVREIASFTVQRDLSSQLEAPKNSTTNTSSGSSGTSTDTATPSDRTNSSGGAGGTTESSDTFDPVSDSNGTDFREESSENLDTEDSSGGYVESEEEFLTPVIDTQVNTTKSEENAMNANIGGTAEQLKQAVLTDYEQEWAANGDDVQIYLEVKDAENELSTDVKDLIREETGSGTVGAWLEIRLFSKVGEEDVVQVTQTNNAVTVAVTVPETLRNADPSVKRNYSVIRLHDGKAERLPAKFDEKTGMLTFETDRFSTYALVYEDVAIPATDPQPDASTQPQTDLLEDPVTDSALPDGTDGAGTNGLPVGAVVAIVIGAVILLGAGGFCLWYFVLRKKKTVSADTDGKEE